MSNLTNIPDVNTSVLNPEVLYGLIKLVLVIFGAVFLIILILFFAMMLLYYFGNKQRLDYKFSNAMQQTKTDIRTWFVRFIYHLKNRSDFLKVNYSFSTLHLATGLISFILTLAFLLFLKDSEFGLGIFLFIILVYYIFVKFAVSLKLNSQRKMAIIDINEFKTTLYKGLAMNGVFFWTLANFWKMIFIG